MRPPPAGREDGAVSGSRARLALLVAVVAGALAAPALADDSAPVPPAAEATYASGVGSVLTPLRPAGTLHVGSLAGTETDRSYLRFDLSGLTGGADGVRLTVPVDLDGGTRSPETATILVCDVSEAVRDGGGEDPPPEADCDGAPTATFVPGDAPAFTVDLPAPAGDVVQVALVPGGDGTWHVAFGRRDRAGGQPATVVVSTAEEASPAPVAPPAITVPPAAPSVATPVTDGPPLRPALPDLSPDPVSSGQAVADEAAAPPTPVATVEIVGSPPFRYPAVFAFPLALLVVLGLAGDGLTRPVRVRADAP
jgi:hypothetical protein